MSTVHHTAIAQNADATAANINAPLAELDAAVTTMLSNPSASGSSFPSSPAHAQMFLLDGVPYWWDFNNYSAWIDAFGTTYSP